MKRALLKIITLVLILTISIFCIGAVENARTVKVGFFEFDGYHNIDSNGNRSGYGYEYLHEMAKATGWTFEYVDGTWEECQEMLENGEIDILTSAQYTEERARVFDFSETPMGTSCSQITVRLDETRYLKSDYKSFDNIVIGMLEGNSRNAKLDEFAEKNGFTYQTKYYASQDELSSALQSKQVDAILTSNLRRLNAESVIAQFDPSPFYAVVKKGNTELLSEVNGALTSIEMYNPAYKYTLFTKSYQGTFANSFALSPEEKKFLDENNVIRVSVRPDARPISYFKDGEAQGIANDIIRKIADELGVTVEFVECETYNQAIELATAGQVDLLNVFEWNYNWAEKNGLRITSPYMNIYYSMVTRDGAKSVIETVACVKNLLINEGYLSNNYDGAKKRLYATAPQAIEAVSKGSADAAFINSYVAEYTIAHNYSNLQMQMIPDQTMTLALGLNKNIDVRLYKILDRKINALSTSEISKIISEHTVLTSDEMTLAQYAKKYPVKTLGITFALLGTVIAALGYSMIAKSRNSKKVFEMAYRDTMTGLWNINGFQLEGAKKVKNGGAYAIFAFDLGDFALINDNYGRDIGDTVIKRVARAVFELNVDNSVLAHVKADHFIEMVPYTGEQELRLRIDAICNAIDRFSIGKNEFNFRVNMGVCIAHNGGELLANIDRAEAAHRSSKRTRTITVYTAKFGEQIAKEKKLEDGIEAALKNGEAVVYFQPKFVISENRMYGAEGLIRWKSREYGFLSPNEFIPILEKSGSIVEVDFFVLEVACKLIRSWLDRGIKPMILSVNQSRANFKKANYFDRLKEVIQKHNVPASLIELEITETLFAQEGITDEAVKKLKEIGFLVSVDDFGSGYSSLYLINKVNVDTLKLDKSLLDDADTNNRVRKVIQKVIEMAQELSFEIICEGVENKEQARFLIECGCDHAQGYLYSRPVPQSEFEAMVEELNRDNAKNSV